MVPVLDENRIPLMPCSEKRARLLMERGQAIPFYQKGIFCIKLTKEPSDRKYQKIALGIDPGSKREGYTVATEKAVVLNITSNTPDWVKRHVEARRSLRKNRRQRKTPYRVQRSNRSTLKKSGPPPSTKARWDAKLRIIKVLKNIIPITIANLEDIKASSKLGKNKWNISFSPLEVGKKYLCSELDKLEIKIIKTKGYDTYKHRVAQDYEKTKEKLSFSWEAHNVDSHMLCEIALGKVIKPNYNVLKLSFLKFHRRQLHVQNPIKGNIRKPYGGTVCFGMSKGSIIKYNKDGELYYLGSYDPKLV